MNYQQCEDFLELHKHGTDLKEKQLGRLRQRLYEKAGDCMAANESLQTKAEQKDRIVLFLNQEAFPVSAGIYLDKTLRLAGYQVLFFNERALGDRRNRWQINGRSLTKKNFCQIMEWLKEALEEVGAQAPGRDQTEQLVAEMAFWQSGAEVLLCYDTAYLLPKMEKVAAYDVPVSNPVPLRVTRRSLKKQTFDYGREKGIPLAQIGEDAAKGAGMTLDTLPFLNKLGYSVEERHAKAAFEEACCQDSFGVISYKPLFILDCAQEESKVRRLSEDIDYYLSGKQVVLLLGATKQTQTEALLEILCRKVSYILTVASPREDRIPAYELAQEALKFHPGVTAVDSIEEAMEIIHMVLPKDGVVLTVGCPELLSRVMELNKK